MRYLFDNIKNIIDYNIREKFHFSRRNFSIKVENTDNLFDGEALLRENELKSKYNFSLLSKDMTVLNYCENLYILDILDKNLQIDSTEYLSICDIGSKNWFYAKSEYIFFTAFCEQLAMSGVEIDANRLYSNLYSRAETAKFHLKNIKSATYLAADFMSINDKFDCITWFLPFVNEFTHIKWGLPQNKFQPQALLEHAYSTLKPNGKMIIINQGQNEFQQQLKMLEESDVPYIERGKVESPFLQYKFERFATIVHKGNPSSRG